VAPRSSSGTGRQVFTDALARAQLRSRQAPPLNRRGSAVFFRAIVHSRRLRSISIRAKTAAQGAAWTAISQFQRHSGRTLPSRNRLAVVPGAVALTKAWLGRKPSPGGTKGMGTTDQLLKAAHERGTDEEKRDFRRGPFRHSATGRMQSHGADAKQYDGCKAICQSCSAFLSVESVPRSSAA
jgi:hypothetical protein